LSGIAASHCNGHANDWTGIYQANRATIGSNPNLIQPGQRLTVKCDDPPQLLRLGSTSAAPAAPATGGSYGHPNFCGDGDGDGWDIACPQQQQHAVFTAPAHQASPSGPVSTAGMGSYQACVISRESGGNSQVMNASGHYGLYQFDYGTWVSGGGAGGDFGHASVSEQNQVFAAVYAARGTQPWSPSDGC
jgi:hypothetical protein